MARKAKVMSEKAKKAAREAVATRGGAVVPSEAVVCVTTTSGRLAVLTPPAVACVEDGGGFSLIHLAGGNQIACDDAAADVLARLGWAEKAAE